MSEAKVFIRAKDETAKAFKSVNAKLGKLGSALTSTTSKIAGLVGVGGFGAFVAISASAAKQATAYAKALNMSTQEMQAWQHAASTVNLEGDKMADIFKDTSEKIGEAFATGGGEAAEALERLNLQAKDLVTLSPDQQMLAIANSLGQVSTQAEKVQIMESLGSDASLLLPLLENNAAKLKQLRQEAIDTGAALSDIDAARLDAANASIARAGSILTGVGQHIAAAIAPYVEAFANLFAKTAAEHNGFKDQILGGVEAIVKAVAFMADMWRGLEAVWQGLKVAFWGTVYGLLKGIGSLGKAIENVLNLLPGVELNGSQYFEGMADSARESMDASIASLDELISKPMPSENVQKFFDDINAMAEKTAAKAVAARDASANAAIPVGLGNSKEDDEKLAEQYAKLQESLLSEEDALRVSYENKEFIVEDAFQNGLIRESERKATLEQLEAEHMQKLYDIQAKAKSAEHQLWEKSWEGKAQIMSGVLGSMSQLMISNNKTMFEIGKKAAVAQAIIDTIASAQGAYKSLASIPVVGPALGAAAAAAALAAGYARVNAIQSTNFDGGGGRSAGADGGVSVGGGQPPETVASTAGNAPQREEPRQQDIMIIQGLDPAKMFSGQQVRDMFDRYVESEKTGVSFA